MIAKAEVASSTLTESVTAIYGLDVVDGVLNITGAQLESFCATTQHSTRSVFECVWVLHRYIYTGVPLIEFTRLDAALSIITELSYRVDEHKSLSQTCTDLACLVSRVSGADKVTHKPLIILGNHGQNVHEPVVPHTSMLQENRRHSLTSSLIAVVSAGEDHVRLELVFDNVRVDRDTVVGYWHTFDKTVQCLMQSSHQTVRAADFLSDHDRNQIIAWNKPVPAEPLEQTICSLFDLQVETQPEAPAIFAFDGTMTYAQLHHTASVFSVDLKAFGVSPGDIVPFCMEKSKWALVAALAILKVGAALVPMDPAWPRQRSTAILEATEASVVVCSNETRKCFDDSSTRVFTVSAESLVNQQSSRSLQMPQPLPQDIAFILFSSGSTGVPKGMIREHRTACVGSLAHAEAMHIDSTSRVLQFANHVFDVAMLDFFTTLVVGGCICIPSEDDRQNNLVAFIRQSQANWVLLTPTIAGMLDPTDVPSLRDVTLGGEAITSELLEKWLPFCRLGINYGSAEVDVTHARDVCDSDDPKNVGKRLPSCICYIVDPNNVSKILPIGATGELLVSGPTMARSYLKQPERTAASFIAAPVDWYNTSSRDSQETCMSRAYRMGDLLQQKRDGSFRFIGRRDFQVKIYGQKVELGEIESHLATHPKVRLCAVLWPRSGPFAERLVAIVELHEGNTQRRHVSPGLGLEDIRSHLSSRVPSYMLPHTGILANPMPLTATLKIDRTKLNTWLVERDVIHASDGILKGVLTSLQGPKLCPNDHTAFQLSIMIANLVAKEDSQTWDSIRGHDHLLSHIGLDSAQTMQLSYLITKRFDRKIPIETLTDQHLTIKCLSNLIDDLSAMNRSVVLRVMTSETLHGKLAQSLCQVQGLHKSIVGSETNGSHLAPRSPNYGSHNVFLTGVTGYLGINILRTLLESTKVGKVYVLVRSVDKSKAWARVARAAGDTNWSVESFVGRLEVWPGDLSQPRLGLEDADFMHLTRYAGKTNMIHHIIHCGAVVDWTKSYDDLESANVTSTIQLLNAALRLRHAATFTYISGGQYFGLDGGRKEERLAKDFQNAAASNGYAQTKFVSEQIVDTVQQWCSTVNDSSLAFRVVKPAYLIGRVENGVANTNDYIWRVVSAAVQQKSYNADEDDQWLLAADVGTVAEAVVELAASATTSSPQTCSSTKIFHGLKVREFWSIIGDVTGRDLVPARSRDWMDGVNAAMHEDSQHILWPLRDVVEQHAGLLTNRQLTFKEMQGHVGVRSMAEAVRKNVEHLVELGFLPGPTPGSAA